MDALVTSALDHVRVRGSAVIVLDGADPTEVRQRLRAAARAAHVRVRTALTGDGTAVLVVDPDFQPTPIMLRALAATMTLGEPVELAAAVEAQRRRTIRPVD